MEKNVVKQSTIRKADPVSLLKKNAMLVVLVLVYIFFTIMTGGRMFRPNSFQLPDQSERLCLYPRLRHADVHAYRRQH